MLSLKTLLFVVAFARPPGHPCSGPLTRDAIVACAARQSPRVRADLERVIAARGEAEAARVLLPENPRLAMTIGQRWNPGEARAVNVSGSLTQRIEIAGERRPRMKAARAEFAARRREVVVTRRHVIAGALLAYYDVLAAREEQRIIARGYAAAERLGVVAKARADAGVGAAVMGDLAAAEVSRFKEQVALAAGRARVAEARLASALGLEPTAALPELVGALVPLEARVDLERAVRDSSGRPEIERARARKRAREAELAWLKRARVPNLSLSVFARTDGFDERVIGGGLGIPIPLPFPVGRTNKGELEAARASVREADERIAAEGRALGLEATVAYHEFVARRQATEAYSAQLDETARRHLDTLAEELERSRLPVRDALLTQQSLIEVLLRSLESRHQLCRASVGLILATGASFEGGPS